VKLNRYDIRDVSHAAARLTAQASTLAALHLNDGTARLRFGFEVARYAKRITDAVSLGPEIQTFLKYGSAAIGVGQSIFSSQVKGVETVLNEIEALHQSSFKREGIYARRNSSRSANSCFVDWTPNSPR
jgi:hypothetical protein